MQQQKIRFGGFFVGSNWQKKQTIFCRHHKRQNWASDFGAKREIYLG